MRIAPVNTIQNNSNPSFKSVDFVDYNSQYNSIKPQLRREIERFANGASNTSTLGVGKFGETFRFNDSALRNVVIKRSKKGYVDDYKKEYENLVQIPTDKVGGQGGIARAYNSSTREYYLLSTLTQGKELSFFNRYKDSHLKSLFNKMFELDKKGIYHGDLNGKNILLTSGGEVNFIDYQWTQIIPESHFFDETKCKNLLLPLSHFPENAQMFEMATMPYYLESMGTFMDKEAFLKMYLRNKAEYHQKRYDYIKNITRNWAYPSELSSIRESLEAERAKAKVYRNPSDNVLKIELKKFQFLSDYRDAFGHVDPHMEDRNILASSSSYLCSISAVQDYRKEIAKQMSSCYDSDMLEYLKSQKTYGDYWYTNLHEFTSSTFDYVMRAVNKTPNAIEKKHKFYIDDIRDPKVVPPNKDVLGAMNSRFHTTYDRNFSTPYGMKGTMHNIFSEPMDEVKSEMGSDIHAYHKYKKVKHAYKEMKEFNSDGKVLDLLNTSQLATLKAREFAGYSRHNMSSYRLDRILQTMHEEASDFTQTLFRTILNGLTEYDARSILVQGYNNMRKFKAKL